MAPFRLVLAMSVCPLFLAAQESGKSATVPSARAHHALAYDTGRREVVLFGGSTPLAGNQFDDTLAGDGGANVLAGELGADNLAGLGGDDLLLGDGRFNISGSGDSGGAILVEDFATANGLPGGNDSLNGGPGNDTLIGGGGDDQLSGGGDNDRLVGGEGGDALRGQAGNDVLLGGNGADFLDGGVGDDLIDGGKLADLMAGAAGNDTYIVDNTGDTILEQSGGGIDLAVDARRAIVQDLADGREHELPEDGSDDQEDDQHPDHQPHVGGDQERAA